ncbi:MAG: glucan biosynthesis protein, partial [Pseudomonadota bacterium]
ERGLQQMSFWLGLLLVFGLSPWVVDAAAADEQSAYSAKKTVAGTFSHEYVIDMASRMSKRAHVPTPPLRRADGNRLDYDTYRAIWFKTEKGVWKQDPPGLELHLYPTGWLYEQPIELNVVENGHVRRIKPRRDLFNVGARSEDAARGMPWGLSGFRINGPLNRDDVADEIVVFQGASYFRAISQGQQYGLSARGLALGVAAATGEEFPFFKRFWVEKPAAGSETITVHALLDSPSVVGAYRFNITPGKLTRTDVTTTLFPRVVLREVGVAPLTSMNILGPLNQRRVPDFRPRVHDSDGLVILNGNGERIWRPINNPKRLQMSWFIDENPRGFGLSQRERHYRAYLDLEARYERRPSAWVEPIGDWGRGSVVLVEIPSEEEIHDNIVAFWRPEKPLEPGKAHQFTYRLSWPDVTPSRTSGPFILRSRAGLAHGWDGRKGKVRFVVDLAGFEKGFGDALPAATVTASQGAVSNVVVQSIPQVPDPATPVHLIAGRTYDTVSGKGPETRPDGAYRVSFVFDPKGRDVSELRLQLAVSKGPTPETWLYRWTQDQ